MGINFAIDTGMGRMGCWQDDAIAELEKISQVPDLNIHSVSTHLPVADEDAAFTESQLAQFDQLVRQMRARVPGSFKVHVLLSAGILGAAKHRFDIVRAGLMLYGSAPLPAEQKFLKPGPGPEVTRRTPARSSGGAQHQLWAHLYHLAADAGRHDQCRLRGWFPALALEP